MPETQGTLSEEVVAELLSYYFVKRMIQRKRKDDNIPRPNAATLSEIYVSEELGKYYEVMFSWYMILAQAILIRFLISATQENFNNLVQYREWFADCTFKVAPHLFYQIYAIHCLCQYATLPMAYFFEPNKIDRPIKELYRLQLNGKRSTSRINSLWFWKSVLSGTRGCV